MSPLTLALLAQVSLLHASQAPKTEWVRQVPLSEQPADPARNNSAMAGAIADARQPLAARTAETVVLQLPPGTFPFAFRDAPGVAIEDFDPGPDRLVIRGNVIESFIPDPIGPALRANQSDDALVALAQGCSATGPGNAVQVPTPRPASSPPGLVEWSQPPGAP